MKILADMSVVGSQVMEKSQPEHIHEWSDVEF